MPRPFPHKRDNTTTKRFASTPSAFSTSRHVFKMQSPPMRLCVMLQQDAAVSAVKQYSSLGGMTTLQPHKVAFLPTPPEALVSSGRNANSPFSVQCR